MATRHRFSSDPNLAHHHEAGATVTLMQTLEHRRLGTISYAWPKHWEYHHNNAYTAFEDLQLLHKELEELPVGSDAMRSIYDLTLIGRLYVAGTQLVSEVVRTLQHLCEEIERWTKTPMRGSTIEERLAGAAEAAGLHLDKRSPGYSAFQEIRAKRDAIEHPKPGNTYNGADTTWDEVPLAWFMSDRVLEAFTTYEAWLTSLDEAWETTKAMLPKQPATFEVRRGLRSERQFKKPPRT